MSRPPRFCRAVALVLAVLLGLAAPACAQAAAGPPAAAPPAAAPVSADELQQLVAALQNPAERDKLVSELQALIAAQRAAAPPPAPPAPTAIFDELSAQIDTVTGEILGASQVVVNAPRLVSWTELQVGDAVSRAFWLSIGLRLAIIFGVGLLAEWVAYLLLRGAARKLGALPGATAATRLFLIVLAIVIEALPVVAFAAAAAFAVPFTHPRFGTRQVARVLIAAILWNRLVLAVARIFLLAPSAAALYPLGEETRNYLYIWARRFTNWAVYGFAVASAAWWLGVPGAIYALILRGTVLVLAILAIIFVLQNRRTVADWLRGNGDAGGGWRLVRNRLADTWHVLAIIYVIGTFGVYVLNVSGGYLFLLRATVVTVLVLLAAALLVRFIERVSRRGFAISSDVKARYPTLEARANRYLPVLHYATALAIYAFAALALLQAWGIDAFAWLDTDTGRRATGTFLTVAIVLVAAFIAWELFSAAIERYLNAIDPTGTPLARSARARTLLPLLRSTVMVLIATLVGLIVLAQVGVNIAPLLAGAGVVGLAVGFGSQALVKDVITGLFILVEDTLAVGEVVDVGKGTGVVDAITIRTIRLRDMTGALQTIPFSEVSTIKNMTRDYAFAVHDVGVLYNEDADRVVATLVEVAAEMRNDPAWSSLVLAPLEVIGLDRFTDSAQVIRVRLKTMPLQQWPVQREFNRRMKKAFDARGIEMPAGNQTHYLPPPPTPPAPEPPAPEPPKA